MVATLESIKRRATQMKKAALAPLKHAHALEAAARLEGFNSFAHARAFLLGRTDKGPRHVDRGDAGEQQENG